MTQKIVEVIDSHTGGEPTRVVTKGGPPLNGSNPLELKNDFKNNHDQFRSAVVNEPRGSDVMVGALLYPPFDKKCLTGVIFFNNVGYLGMCGHATIGLIRTFLLTNNLSPGNYKIETPVGIVPVTLHDNGYVSFKNVASYRYQQDVTFDLPGYGEICGDIAWGGNWFFLVKEHKEKLVSTNVEHLKNVCWMIREALEKNEITGANSEEIDHIELFGPSEIDGVNSKNFVLCPGKAYDRSPCGTGTSAKLACLYADGKLLPGDIWRQESIVGSIFEGSVEVIDEQIFPIIKGTAFVNAKSELIFDPDDPFEMGIRL